MKYGLDLSQSLSWALYREIEIRFEAKQIETIGAQEARAHKLPVANQFPFDSELVIIRGSQTAKDRCQGPILLIRLSRGQWHGIKMDVVKL